MNILGCWVAPEWNEEKCFSLRGRLSLGTEHSCSPGSSLRGSNCPEKQTHIFKTIFGSRLSFETMLKDKHGKCSIHYETMRKYKHGKC